MPDPSYTTCLNVDQGYGYAGGDTWPRDLSGPGTRPGDVLPAGPWLGVGPAEAAKLDRRKEALGGGGYRDGGRIGSADSVQVLSQHADDLTQRLGTRVYWELLDDPKVRSCILSVLHGAMADDFTLSVPVKEDDPDAALAAEIVDRCQRSLDRLTPSLEFTLRQMLLSTLVEAEALAEIIMDVADTGPDAGKWILKSLATKTLADWAFLVDRKKHVVGYGGADEDRNRVRLDPAKVAVMVWQPRAGDPRGTYMLKPSYPYVDFKLRSIDDYYQNLHHYGKPIKVGKTDSKSQPRPRTDRDPYVPGMPDVTPEEDMANAFAFDQGYYVVKGDGDIQIVPPAGQGTEHKEGFAFCDGQIAIGIVIDERGLGAVDFGSRASAEVGQDNRNLVVADSRAMLCDLIYGVLKELVKANHGPEKAARLTPWVGKQQAAQEDAQSERYSWAQTGYVIDPTIHPPEIDAKLGLTPRPAAAPTAEEPPAGEVAATTAAQKALQTGEAATGDAATMAAFAGPGVTFEQIDGEAVPIFESYASFIAAKKGSKLTGGAWKTKNHRHLYIKGGKIVAGLGLQAGKGPLAKSTKGGGGGAGTDGTPTPTRLPASNRLSAPTKPASPAASARPAASAPSPASEKPREPLPKLKQGARSLVIEPAEEVQKFHDTVSADWKKGLSAKEASAVSSYSSSQFGEANSLLRHGTVAAGTDKKAVRAITKDVDKALDKASLSESVVVYRGVKDLRAMGLDPDPAKLIGATVRDKAYLSTSLTPKPASRFIDKNKGAIFRIDAPQGSKGASVAGLTNGKGEQEILFHRNSSLKITGLSRDKGRLVIDAVLSHDD